MSKSFQNKCIKEDPHTFHRSKINLFAIFWCQTFIRGGEEKWNAVLFLFLFLRLLLQYSLYYPWKRNKHWQFNIDPSLWLWTSRWDHQREELLFLYSSTLTPAAGSWCWESTHNCNRITDPVHLSLCRAARCSCSRPETYRSTSSTATTSCSHNL